MGRGRVVITLRAGRKAAGRGGFFRDNTPYLVAAVVADEQGAVAGEDGVGRAAPHLSARRLPAPREILIIALPRAVGVDFYDAGARRRFDADIRARPDADVELFAVGTEDKRARPVLVVAAAGQPEDTLRRAARLQVAAVVGEAHDRVGIGDV